MERETSIKRDTYMLKSDIVRYVIYKHKKDTNFNISPIKLHKSLYLLYAMWVGLAANINNELDKTAQAAEKLKVELFDANFEAWKYGPVEKEVYDKYEHYTGSSNIQIESEHENTIKNFIDNILDQVFEISDFVLVDITREDKSYLAAYNGNRKISIEDILIEYKDKIEEQH